MELNARTQTLHLKCARYDANIKGVDASEFPVIPTLGEQNKITIEPDVLREMIAQAAFAAAQDDSRPVLTGIFAKFDQDSVTFAAADGFRLSVRSAVLDSKVSTPVSVIIPAKALQDVARIIGDQEEPVEIAITENRSQVLFPRLHPDCPQELCDAHGHEYHRPAKRGQSGVGLCARIVQHCAFEYLSFPRSAQRNSRKQRK